MNGSAARGHATLDDLLAIIEPGETLAYNEIIERLKFVGRPTAGIGRVFEQIAFHGQSEGWRGSEVISYREPYFDAHHECDWTEGTLFVRRRGPQRWDTR